MLNNIAINDVNVYLSNQFDKHTEAHKLVGAWYSNRDANGTTISQTHTPPRALGN